MKQIANNEQNIDIELNGIGKSFDNLSDKEQRTVALILSKTKNWLELPSINEEYNHNPKEDERPLYNAIEKFCDGMNRTERENILYVVKEEWERRISGTLTENEKMLSESEEALVQELLKSKEREGAFYRRRKLAAEDVSRKLLLLSEVERNDDVKEALATRRGYQLEQIAEDFHQEEIKKRIPAFYQELQNAIKQGDSTKVKQILSADENKDLKTGRAMFTKEKTTLRAVAYTMWQDTALKALDAKTNSDFAYYATLGQQMSSRWQIVRTIDDSNKLEIEGTTSAQFTKQKIIPEFYDAIKDLDPPINNQIRENFPRVFSRKNINPQESANSHLQTTAHALLGAKKDAASLLLYKEYITTHKADFILRTPAQIMATVKKELGKNATTEQINNEVEKRTKEQQANFSQKIEKLVILFNQNPKKLEAINIVDAIDNKQLTKEQKDTIEEAFKIWNEDFKKEVMNFKPIEFQKITLSYNEKDADNKTLIESLLGAKEQFANKDPIEFAIFCKQKKEEYYRRLYLDQAAKGDIQEKKDPIEEMNCLNIAIEKFSKEFSLSSLKQKFEEAIQKEKQLRPAERIKQKTGVDPIKNFIEDSIAEGVKEEDLGHILYSNNYRDLFITQYIERLSKIRPEKDQNKDFTPPTPREEKQAQDILSAIKNKDVIEGILEEISEHDNRELLYLQKSLKKKQDDIETIEEGVKQALQTLNDDNEGEEKIQPATFLMQLKPNQVLRAIESYNGNNIKSIAKDRAIYDTLRGEGACRFQQWPQNLRSIQANREKEILQEFMGIDAINTEKNCHDLNGRPHAEAHDWDRYEELKEKIASFYLKQQELGLNPEMVDTILKEIETKFDAQTNLDTANKGFPQADKEQFLNNYKIFQKYAKPETQTRKIEDHYVVAASAIRNLEKQVISKESWDINTQREKLKERWFGKKWWENIKSWGNKGDLTQPNNTLTQFQKEDAKVAFFNQIARLTIEQQRQYIPQYASDQKREALARGEIELAKKWEDYAKILKEDVGRAAQYKVRGMVADYIQKQLSLSEEMLLGYSEKDRARIKGRIGQMADNVMKIGQFGEELEKCETDEDIYSFFNEDRTKTRLNRSIGEEMDNLQLATICPIDDIEGLKRSFGDNDRIEYLRSAAPKDPSPKKIADTLIKQRKCEENGESQALIDKLQAKEEKKLDKEREAIASKKVQEKEEKEKNRKFNKKLFLLALVLGTNPLIALLFAHPTALKTLGNITKAVIGAVSFVPALLYSSIAAACAEKGKRSEIFSKFMNPTLKCFDFSDQTEKMRESVTLPEERIKQYITKNPPIKLSNKIKGVESISQGKNGKFQVKISEIAPLIEAPKVMNIEQIDDNKQKIQDGQRDVQKENDHKIDEVELKEIVKKIQLRSKSVIDSNKEFIDLDQENQSVDIDLDKKKKLINIVQRGGGAKKHLTKRRSLSVGEKKGNENYFGK